jgi:hypothetical protein
MGFGASGATSLLHDGERAAVNSHTRRNATCAPPRTLASDNAENGGAEATVRCIGLQRVFVAPCQEMPNLTVTSFENGGHHALLRATQSPIACVRWVGHGI